MKNYKSASMYDSDDEYSFVILSRSNSFKKVSNNFLHSINLSVNFVGKNPKECFPVFKIYRSLTWNHLHLLVALSLLFHFRSPDKFIFLPLLLYKIHWLLLTNIFFLHFYSRLQPASYGKKVSLKYIES